METSILERFSLQGKVALVTGGAGLYGRQIVRALAEAGAETYSAARRLDALEQVAAGERARGGRVTALQFDQGNEGTIRALRDEIVRRSGTIDVLVNNAVARPMQKGWEDDAARFDESLHINATGLFMTTRAVGEVMLEHGSGSIINIGSMMGMVGVEPGNYEGTAMHGFYPDYFFHKGGMINFTRFCASYFGRRQVRVNCVSPGGFFNNQPARFVEQYSARTQLGRMANETDLMGVIVFLASDASGYITGANIPVDGGYTAK
ncbi:MAG: SDR family oxidoreductase [Opitutae bacterium]|nr:SDR family oxidoreductase [Opitutae bacterium]